MISTTKFLIVFGILIAFLLLYGIRPTWAWLALPLVLGIQFLLVTAGSALTAILIPLVPDLRVIINNLMTLMLFISGIFFTLDDLPDRSRVLLQLNPMATLIDAFRTVLLDGKWPDFLPLAGVALFSIISLAAMFRVYRHYDLELPKLVL